MTGGYTVPSTRAPIGLPEMHSQLMDLAESIRNDRGWESVSWEMDCRHSGE